MPRELTAKEEGFAQAVAGGMNASDAYRKHYATANMAPSGVHEHASRLAARDKVRARIAELRRESEPVVVERVGHNLADAIAELCKVGFASITDAVAWDAETGITIRSSEEIPPHVAAAIQSVRCERERIVRGNGEDATPWVVEKVEIKFHGKVSALDKVVRHFGGYPKAADLSVNQQFNDNRAVFAGIPEHVLRAAFERLGGYDGN
jgi:hypothetical protein